MGEKKSIACKNPSCKRYKNRAYYMRDDYLKHKQELVEVYWCPTCNQEFDKIPKSSKWLKD